MAAQQQTMLHPVVPRSWSLKAMPPYGTIDLLCWGEEVSAKQGARARVPECTGASLPILSVERARSDCSAGLQSSKRSPRVQHALAHSSLFVSYLVPRFATDGHSIEASACPNAGGSFAPAVGSLPRRGFTAGSVSSPAIRFSSEDLPQPNRYTRTIRITCKLLKIIARASLYSVHIPTVDVARNDAGNLPACEALCCG